MLFITLMTKKMSGTAEAKYEYDKRLSEAEVGRHRDVDWETNA